MSFDWPEFLRSRGIEYAESGRNVSRGNIVTHCPLCGAGDEGMHLSISLEGSGWRCMRHPREHRGVNPAPLVQRLLGCSWETARTITGSSIHLPDDFLSAVNNRMLPPMEPTKTPLRLPNEFQDFTTFRPSQRLYYKYLVGRGFTQTQIEWLTFDYGMYYCSRGSYKGRIIFAVEDKGRLMTWTGRTIYESQPARYKTLSPDPDKSWKEGYAPAINPITQHLLWQDNLRHPYANTIILCEGPFDSLKINVLGRKAGVVSTCFFTSEPSDEQIDLMHELLPRFRKRYLLLDRGTVPTSLRLSGELQTLDVQPLHLPSQFKDPGELQNTRQLLQIVSL